MSHIGFYSGINLIDTSSVLSANLEFNRERIAAEAQDLANECECDIEAWTRDDDGEQASHTAITARPNK
ncbi:hypothetical protein PO883_31740 [Massilia sp. DJPM01]|uniref:hypothetical protein n=1 Tax=Massilia sp. DJPM01 TaxID=3024404 RepID=UPI00259F065D|nr:hypothetical protein [Massilia sp. DJPM01]MDM5181755.1 hypothetical protein [Massilia sp. DJPM01]